MKRNRNRKRLIKNKTMKQLKAHFKDKNHDTDIIINNTEGEYADSPLSFEIDGISFLGSAFFDFELADPSCYESAKSKFNILKWGNFSFFGDHKTPYTYTLQRFELSVEIPILAFDKKEEKQTEGILNLHFELKESDKKGSICYCDNERVYFDKPEIYDFSFCVDDKKYICENKTAFFETALNELSEKMANDYYFMSCFTCQYSDYSPYGQDDFGCMLCYKDYKEDCLKVNSKAEYFEHLDGKKCFACQETFICPEFCLRTISEGYRGRVKGI